MKDGPWISDSSGNKDLMATIFYMINCLQERNAPPENIDHFGRFRFDASYQYRFNCITENLVLEHVKDLSKEWDISMGSPGKTRLHISHDIDTLKGTLLQTSYHLLRHGRIVDAIRNAAGLNFSPYNNVEDLEAMNIAADLKSTYFFIPVEGYGQYGIKNADYTVDELNAVVADLEQRGNEIEHQFAFREGTACDGSTREGTGSYP